MNLGQFAGSVECVATHFADGAWQGNFLDGRATQKGTFADGGDALIEYYLACLGAVGECQIADGLHLLWQGEGCHLLALGEAGAWNFLYCSRDVDGCHR